MDALDHIAAHAQELGFQHLRVASVTLPSPRAQEFQDWLDAKHHGDMAYLEKGALARVQVCGRMPTARSVVVLAMQHDHARPPDPGGLTGLVARYAWGRDYHNLAGKRLRKLQKRLRADGIGCWGGIDTAPILERAWAEAAGLGYSGKNCLQILPASGSYLFLAVIFVDVPLPPTPAITRDHCGSCTRCLVACPTQAFVAPHVLHAPRCISFLTIESRAAIPPELRAGMGRWVFGCDVCQEVCPHNAKPPATLHPDFAPRHAYLDLPWLLEAGEREIMARFLGTPLRRPGAAGLKRNACVVLGNLGHSEATPVLRRTVETADAMVAEHARWALERLGG